MAINCQFPAKRAQRMAGIRGSLALPIEVMVACAVTGGSDPVALPAGRGQAASDR
jgi:hypothetical protein